MEIKSNMEKEINKQINAELQSEYLYLSMSAFFESVNFSGFAHWMKLQAKEEREHAMKLFKYLNERGGRVKLLALTEPKFDWKSPLDAFSNAYEHEKKVTQMIDNLVTMARKDKDYATEVFLHWFVDEQVEEEDTASGIVEKLKMIGDSKNGLFMLDRELAKRE